MLCSASVGVLFLGLSCQGQGRVSPEQSVFVSLCAFLWSLKTELFPPYFSSPFILPPVTYITLTGDINRIYWFFSLSLCCSICICLVFLRQALLLSFHLVVCLLLPLLSSDYFLHTPILCKKRALFQLWGTSVDIITAWSHPCYSSTALDL